jgi:S-adenosylmethionine hydrolase
MELKPWLDQVKPQELPPAQQVILPSGKRLPLSTTFGAVPAGDPVAYLGSEQLLEIAINGGSAADKLGLAIGDPIKLRFGANS